MLYWNYCSIGLSMVTLLAIAEVVHVCAHVESVVVSLLHSPQIRTFVVRKFLRFESHREDSFCSRVGYGTMLQSGR
jgi:hypothetical protein